MSLPILVHERQSDVRKTYDALTGPFQEVARCFSGHRAYLNPNRPGNTSPNVGTLVFEATTRASDLSSLFSRFQPDQAILKQLDATNGYDLQNQESFGSIREEFYGMPSTAWIEELAGRTRALQANFENAQAELEKTGLKEALEEASIGMRKKRKRLLMEHDGEWDYDRRYDTHAFVGTQMRKKEFPYLEVCFPINMLSSASRTDISMFGARCLAVCDILENLGYRVGVTMEDWNAGCLQSPIGDLTSSLGWAKTGTTTTLHRMILREPSEYGTIQDFATMASCEFFRRAIFGLVRAGISLLHGLGTTNPDSSFGQSLTFRPIPAVPGQLVLDINTILPCFPSMILPRQPLSSMSDLPIA